MDGGVGLDPFQLLRLLLIYGRPVTPFYLMDPTRSSTQVELKTMQRIRDRLVKEYPQTGELLLPTRLFDVAELAAGSRDRRCVQSRREA